MKYPAALALIACLNLVKCGVVLSAQQLDDPSVSPGPLDVLSQLLQPTDVWDSVHGLPPGTRLRLIFHDGSEITGTVVETRPDTVVMNDNQPGRAGVRIPQGSSLRDRLTFRRSDVAGVSVLKVPTRYRASGAPDAVTVRHVVTALGIDKKIDLTPSNGSQGMRVRIQSIEQNGFTYVHGLRSAVDSIAYGDVSQVRPAGMHWAVKAAIIYVGGGVLVSVILAMINAANS